MRTPYGKEVLVESGMIFAERGYNVLCVDSRGRFGSSGDFFPVENEILDAESCMRFLEGQPWHNGLFGTHGVSYNGFCTYTNLEVAGRHAEGMGLGAIAPIMASARLRPVLYIGTPGVLNLELAVRWLWIV